MPIREMTEDDLDAVLDIIESHDDEDAEAAEAYFEVAFGDEDDDDELADRHFVHVDDEGKIAGVCGVLEDEDEGKGIFWLGWFYVDGAHRRHGIGEGLLERSLAWARERGGRKIYVDVSALPMYEDARRFYAAHGFAEEGRLLEYYNPGEDCLLLGRTL